MLSPMNWPEQEPLLAAISAASVQGQVATGERAGKRVRCVLADPAAGIRSGPLCFAARGFSLHAATRIVATDRTGLERLCRYVTRPPLAAGRLQMVDAEHLTFRLKTPWSDGTSHLVLSPLELIEKLAALVPPPRLNLIRYHGVLAPNAAHREKIVPAQPPTQDDPPATGEATPQTGGSHRLSWAALLARVFDIDINVCSACGGPMRIIAALTDAVSIRCYLQGVGLPADPPPIAPPRPPPQHEFNFAA